MAIQSSRFYNNPQIGAAMENIAGMFAPPDSGELVNYAQAAGLRQKQSIIDSLKSDPRYQGADAGVLADLFDPTNSWAAQDQNTATARRGQDITAATSITNNKADNQRAFVTSMFGDVAQDALRPAVPASVSGLFGVSEALPQVNGNRSPLSATQVEGQELLRLIGEGDITDKMQVDNYLGQNTPVKVVSEDGRVTYASPGAALGQTAYVDQGSQPKPDLYSYRTPDGQVGTAIVGEGGQLVDSQTQEKLPPGTRAAKATMQGSAEEVGMAPTTANTTAANNRRAEVTRALNLLDLYEGVVKQDPSAIGMAGAIKGLAQNAIAVTQDLASTFGTSVPELEQFSGELRAGLSAVAPEMFNPNIPEAAFYQGALAYALARTENPSGEVSRQAYERALDRVTGGALQNSQSAQAAVGAFREMLNTELSAIKALDDPNTARTDTSYQGGGTEPARPQTEAEWAALPSGALFVDPDDGKTYRKE